PSDPAMQRDGRVYIACVRIEYLQFSQNRITAIKLASSCIGTLHMLFNSNIPFSRPIFALFLPRSHPQSLIPNITFFLGHPKAPVVMSFHLSSGKTHLDSGQLHSSRLRQ
ncbi:hypothetical protein QBC45DRAFT_309366, partial [Copromyces sp. CBS 386.78]